MIEILRVQDFLHFCMRTVETSDSDCAKIGSWLKATRVDSPSLVCPIAREKARSLALIKGTGVSDYFYQVARPSFTDCLFLAISDRLEQSLFPTGSQVSEAVLLIQTFYRL